MSGRSENRRVIWRTRCSAQTNRLLKECEMFLAQSDDPWFAARQGAGYFSFLQNFQTVPEANKPPLFDGHWCSFPVVKRPGLEADHFHLVLMLRMGGALPPLSVRVYGFMAWTRTLALLSEIVTHTFSQSSDTTGVLISS